MKNNMDKNKSVGGGEKEVGDNLKRVSRIFSGS